MEAQLLAYALKALTGRKWKKHYIFCRAEGSGQIGEACDLRETSSVVLHSSPFVW
jgi:hypothetical protein